MQNEPALDNRAEQRLKSHGLTGLYAPAGAGAVVDARSDLPALLRTSLPVQVESAEPFAVATTGSACALPGGGAVVVSGRPDFRDPALSSIAQSSGAAAAVARAYADHDAGLFAHIGGAFSLCIIDTGAQRVLAGIDRLGQHSLYYQLDAGVFAFGSEAGVALACTQSAPHLQSQGLYNYLYFHMVPSPGTVYARLSKLPAAHYLEFSDNRVQRTNYWQPMFRESADGVSFETLGRELKTHMTDAVDRSRQGAGRIGAFLSGGLDSSTVTGVMSELGDRGAEAFSIGFEAEGYDEMAYARLTAKHFGVRLNEYYVTPEDVVAALPLVATRYDEPFGNSSALPAYFCARMAADNGVDTLLAGDGGDEIFGGNERYQRQEVFRYYERVPALLRRALIEPLANALPQALPLVGKARSYIAQANTPLPDRLQSYNFLHRHAADEIFTDAFLAHVDRELPLRLLRTYYQQPAQACELHRMLYLDWQITLADNDLRKVSQMCALAGVDVAYPMLDDELVAFACSVPPQWKIRNGNLRHFYKEALRGWLPTETIDKSKKGFGLPFGVWMRTYTPLRELAYDNLLKLKTRGFIHPRFIDRAIEMHQSQHAAYYGELVWILTVLELWLAGRSADLGATESTATGTIA